MITAIKNAKSHKELGIYTKIVLHITDLRSRLCLSMVSARKVYMKAARISAFHSQFYLPKVDVLQNNWIGLVDDYDRFKSHDALQTARELLEEYPLFLGIKDPEGSDYAKTAQLLEEILQVEQKFFHAETA
jgi:hypothetical protein